MEYQQKQEPSHNRSPKKNFYLFSFTDKGSVNSGFTPVSSSFPLSAISLMVSSSPFYNDAVNSMVVAANMVYREFLKSDEGQGFRGEVGMRVNAS